MATGMRRVPREVIELFVNITGASESVAVQKLLECEGDLNRAVNAHFNGEDTAIVHQQLPAREDPFNNGFSRTSWIPSENMDPFSFILSPNLINSIFNSRLPVEFANHSPQVSHPRESREIPIEFRDSNTGGGSAVRYPVIEELTEDESFYGPEARDTVTFDDEDEGDNYHFAVQESLADVSNNAPIPTQSGSSAPMHNDEEDIEDEMIQAAIRASQCDTQDDEHLSSQHADQETNTKQYMEEDLERTLAIKQAALPLEPPQDDENVVMVLIRMPDGGRHGRCFLKSDKLQYLFDFIDTGRYAKPGTYRLVRSYPRQVFTVDDSERSLDGVGITSKQEALFLELL